MSICTSTLKIYSLRFAKRFRAEEPSTTCWCMSTITSTRCLRTVRSRTKKLGLWRMKLTQRYSIWRFITLTSSLLCQLKGLFTPLTSPIFFLQKIWKKLWSSRKLRIFYSKKSNRSLDRNLWTWREKSSLLPEERSSKKMASTMIKFMSSSTAEATSLASKICSRILKTKFKSRMLGVMLQALPQWLPLIWII